MSCTQKRNFWLFFDWIYPYHEVILRAIESNYDHPVAITILRFVAELANNRSSRLNFEITSANGYFFYFYFYFYFFFYFYFYFILFYFILIVINAIIRILFVVYF